MQLSALLIFTPVLISHIVPAPTVLERAQAIMQASKARDNERDGQRMVALLTLGRHLEDLSFEELFLLATARNWTGETIEQIAACDAALKRAPCHGKALELKANGLYNLSSRTSDRSKELAFYEECIRLNPPDSALWHLRKARALCQSSVKSKVFQAKFHRWITDKDAYEAAFVALERAFELEPGLLQADRSGTLVDWLIPQHFPLLHEEERFKRLLKIRP